MNYADVTCHFCGFAFESLPFFGCCGRCYRRCARVRAVVDKAHPVSPNAFVRQPDGREAVL